MIELLNKVENWTYSGPMGNDLLQPPEDDEYEDTWGDYSLDDLITAEGPGALYQAAGFDQLGEDAMGAEEWAGLYGAYLTPYDRTAESAINLSFMDTMTQKFTEAYGGLSQVTTSLGRSGFGTSYSGGANVQDVLSNTAASMGTARHQKDQAIHSKRTDWVDDLWNDFAYLAQLGALHSDT
tara:strand:- start:5999 stop:6541 length:543 start_codon:yes stop_codon:yes gene_type:complete